MDRNVGTYSQGCLYLIISTTSSRRNSSTGNARPGMWIMGQFPAQGIWACREGHKKESHKHTSKPSLVKPFRFREFTFCTSLKIGPARLQAVLLWPVGVLLAAMGRSLGVTAVRSDHLLGNNNGKPITCQGFFFIFD